MDREKIEKMIDNVSDPGIGLSFIIHVLNNIEETARRKGMFYGFLLGISASTAIYVLVSRL